jgi:RHS repeat-associated protein
LPNLGSIGVKAGLYYYRARWYDATTGRFVSNDPIGFAGLDTNLARYVQNSPTSFTDPTGNTAVNSGASWRPTTSDIRDVTGRYNRYLNWLSTVWNAVMFKAGGTNLITAVNISNVGYFHVYSAPGPLQPSEWMATIAYDRNDPDDMLIAELTARRIQDRMTVDTIGGITTSAIVNGFDIAIRTAFDPIDTLASFVEFTKKPSWSALLGMAPFIPGTTSRFAGLTPNTAAAHAFHRLKHRSLQEPAKIAQYAADMKLNGWRGDPIAIFEHGGQKYILDGHHRVAAARQAGIEVPYHSIAESDLPEFDYKDTADLLRAASEAFGI